MKRENHDTIRRDHDPGKRTSEQVRRRREMPQPQPEVTDVGSGGRYPRMLCRIESDRLVGLVHSVRKPIPIHVEHEQVVVSRRGQRVAPHPERSSSRSPEVRFRIGEVPAIMLQDSPAEVRVGEVYLGGGHGAPRESFRSPKPQHTPCMICRDTAQPSGGVAPAGGLRVYMGRRFCELERCLAQVVHLGPLPNLLAGRRHTRGIGRFGAVRKKSEARDCIRQFGSTFDSPGKPLLLLRIHPPEEAVAVGRCHLAPE